MNRYLENVAFALYVVGVYIAIGIGYLESVILPKDMEPLQ